MASIKKTKERILCYLENNGGLNESDEEIVNLYAETFYFYQKMRSELKKSSLLLPYTNKVGATNYVKNPLAIEITKTVQTLNNLLKSMGLTPAQRKTVVPPEDGDMFDNF